jgi:hypothetical protein
MTTLRQIRKVLKPLTERNDDLALVGNFVVVRPLRHIFRGILIDRVGEAARCRPRWGVTELFSKQNDFPVGNGELIYHPTDLWWWSDPGMAQTLVEVVEGDVLPKLRAIETIGDYANFALPRDPAKFAPYRSLQVLLLIAMGDLDEAANILMTEKDMLERWISRLERLDLKEKLVELGDKLGANDRAKLAGLLHDWEAYTVDKLKLGEIWELTPFPLEEVGSKR